MVVALKDRDQAQNKLLVSSGFILVCSCGHEKTGDSGAIKTNNELRVAVLHSPYSSTMIQEMAVNFPGSVALGYILLNAVATCFPPPSCDFFSSSQA